MGALSWPYWIVKRDSVEQVDGGVIAESTLSIYVNGQSLATVLCSPFDQEALALGLLFNEGIIRSYADVGLIKSNEHRTVVDVWLHTPNFEPPQRVIITTGCSGGITLQELTVSYPPLETDFRTSTDVVFNRMHDLQEAAELYHQVRGVHTALLADRDQPLISAEDVGRHNAVDKLMGKALQRGISTRDRIILTSGRISSEMVSKAWRMYIPLVISRTAPTSKALELADAWQMTIVGYVRQGGMRIYTHPERLIP
jgi:FdhD protein